MKTKKSNDITPFPCDEILKEVSETYKLINFTDVDEPYRENVRQARKKLNKIAGTINKWNKFGLNSK